MSLTRPTFPIDSWAESVREEYRRIAAEETPMSDRFPDPCSVRGCRALSESGTDKCMHHHYRPLSAEVAASVAWWDSRHAPVRSPFTRRAMTAALPVKELGR